jgi:DNA-binding response OmpR family regulator
MARPRILVVDDAVMVRRHVRRTLDQAGMDVDEASDGAEAITAMSRTAYALVLLDLEMPKMSGTDVLHVLGGGTIAPVPPILVLTSLEMQPAELKQLRDCGVVGFVDKAVASDQLVFRVRTALSSPADCGAAQHEPGSEL